MLSQSLGDKREVPGLERFDSDEWPLGEGMNASSFSGIGLFFDGWQLD